MDFSNIVGLDWDDNNFYKNIGKHNIFDTEAEQIFFNHPLVIKHDSTDYLNWEESQAARFPKLKPITKSISIRLPQNLIDDL